MSTIENITPEKAMTILQSGYKNAESMLKDTDKVEKLLQRLEEKLKLIPVAGKKLSYIPVLISLVRNYIRKEYTDIPVGTVIAIISALAYVVSPIDLIPDAIPVIGYLDDAAVIAACWDLVESDVDEYIKWRDENIK